MSRQRFWGLLGLTCCITTGIVAWAAARRDVALFLYGRACFWIILTLLVLWSYEGLRFLREIGFRPGECLRRNGVPLLTALLITLVAVKSVRGQFRVLSDETNLLAVSQSMFYHKTPYNSTEQKRYYGWMNPLNFHAEKRPLVFPFLLYLVHSVLGYSPENVFVLNAGVFFALLAIIGMIAQRKMSGAATVAAVLLVGSYPLVVNCGRSAGLDLLATVFTLASFALAYFYMRAPSASRLALLASTLLVCTQIRYESFLHAAIIVVALFAFGYLRESFLRERPAIYCLVPLLLLPLFIQRILNPSPHENPAGMAPFAWEHLTKFVGIFVRAQGNLEFLLPHAPLLYWAAAPILAFFTVCLLRQKLKLGPARRWHLLAMASVAFLLNYAVIFSFHGSDFTHPGAVRYFINLSVLVALLPVFLHLQAPRFLTGPRLLALAGVSAIVFHPVSVQGKFTLVQTLVRETEFEWDFLRRYNDPNIMIITERPGQFTVRDYGAVGYDYANQNAETLLYELKRHLYTQILVFQKIEYGMPDAPPRSDYLVPAFKLQTLVELQNSATGYVRISRVVL